jgi:4-hydroxy-2-oxoheptanedioate aldolase
MGEPAAVLREQAGRTTVIAMIEDQEALTEVGAIARVDGIDAIFVGPNDLAASMGFLGESGHPEVRKAVAAIRDELTTIPNSPVFATIARNGPQARELAEQGARMLCFNTTYILGAALKSLRAELNA